jgi:NAD(P)-dependent dehydrogenase (short-subunit alcohol dehydrogenase family)
VTGATPNWLNARRALVVGNSPAADAVAAAFTGLGARTARAGAEIVEVAEIADSFAAAETSCDGSIEILVHAGIQMPNAAAETFDLDRWRTTQSADIDGRFLHAAEFTRRRLIARGHGAILFLMPSPAIPTGRVTTATAHGALENLVKSLAVEWARDGIRTNAIASRVVEHFAAATEAEQKSLGNLAAYLVSDYAAYVTGCLMGVAEV